MELFLSSCVDLWYYFQPCLIIHINLFIPVSKTTSIEMMKQMFEEWIVVGKDDMKDDKRQRIEMKSIDIDFGWIFGNDFGIILTLTWFGSW